MRELTTIPASVRELLKHRWREPTGGRSMFDLVMEDRPYDPSFYFIRPGGEVNECTAQFTFDEAVALMNEGAFGDHAELHDGVIGVNEHAAHALQDFCAEAYKAWGKYRQRLATVPRLDAA